jgi:hypothetical protein
MVEKRSYDAITIFVLPHPKVENSFALTPIRYYGGPDSEEYDFDETQEYNDLDLALSNAVSLALLYESQHPNASICVIDNQGNDYDWREADQKRRARWTTTVER